jgi:hypothetical protein
MVRWPKHYFETRDHFPCLPNRLRAEFSLRSCPTTDNPKSTGCFWMVDPLNVAHSRREFTSRRSVTKRAPACSEAVLGLSEPRPSGIL